MPSPEVFIECPFCSEKRANYRVHRIDGPITRNVFGRIRPEVQFHGEGTCYLCSNRAFLFFTAKELGNSPIPLEQIPSGLGTAQPYKEGFVIQGYVMECVQTFPEPEALDCPEHLPFAIDEVFREADANFRDRRWRSAVTGYGTAVDFAAAKFVEGDPSSTSKLALGAKMKKLKTQGLVPGSLVELMEIVNLERRASVHYESPVDERAARGARSVTIATLEYLFTLPKQIEKASERLIAAQQEPDPAALSPTSTRPRLD